MLVHIQRWLYTYWIHLGLELLDLFGIYRDFGCQLQKHILRIDFVLGHSIEAVSKMALYLSAIIIITPSQCYTMYSK